MIPAFYCQKNSALQGWKSLVISKDFLDYVWRETFERHRITRRSRKWLCGPPQLTDQGTVLPNTATRAVPRYRPMRMRAQPFQTHVYLHLSNLVVLFFYPLAATFLG
jgi:hypothetical protein